MEIIEIIKEEIIIILLAAAPISELRGAIPLGIALGFTPINSTILAIIGNILPVPFLLSLLRPIFDYIEETKYGHLVTWLKRRTLKRSKRVKEYRILGLYLLVAIPLPYTGAWTGCVAATMFNINYKQSLLTIVAGIVTAGIIVLTFSDFIYSLSI